MNSHDVEVDHQDPAVDQIPGVDQNANADAAVDQVEENHAVQQPGARKKRKPIIKWTEAEYKALREAVKRYLEENKGKVIKKSDKKWETIKNSNPGVFHERRTATDLKDAWDRLSVRDNKEATSLARAKRASARDATRAAKAKSRKEAASAAKAKAAAGAVHSPSFPTCQISGIMQQPSLDATVAASAAVGNTSGEQHLMCPPLYANQLRSLTMRFAGAQEKIFSESPSFASSTGTSSIGQHSSSDGQHSSSDGQQARGGGSLLLSREPILGQPSPRGSVADLRALTAKFVADQEKVLTEIEQVVGKRQETGVSSIANQ